MIFGQSFYDELICLFFHGSETERDKMGHALLYAGIRVRTPNISFESKNKINRALKIQLSHLVFFF